MPWQPGHTTTRALVGGRIHTMETPDATTDAIAWDGDTIAALGHAAVTAWADAQGIQPEELQGRTVLPGFVDAHTHFLHVGVKHTRPDLRHCTTRQEALDLVADWLSTHEGPVIAEGWDEGDWDGDAPPTKQELDVLAPDRPLVMRRICGHIAIANTAALPTIRACWDDDALVDLDTGILLEQPSLYLNEVLPVSEEGLDDALAAACRIAHRLGVTAVGDYSQAPYRDALLRAARRGTLTVRTACSIYVQQLQDAIDEGFQTGRPAAGPDGPSSWFTDGGLKVFLDGSLGGHTAALREPYLDKDTSGMPNWSDEEVEGYFRRAHGHGIQVHAHAIGDAAIDQGLAAFAKLQDAAGPDGDTHMSDRSDGSGASRVSGGAGMPGASGISDGSGSSGVAGADGMSSVSDGSGMPGKSGTTSATGGRSWDDARLRHRFEHYEIVHDEQVERSRALGVVASSQPNFVGEWSAKGGMYEARLGPRFLLNNRFRTFKRHGLRLAFGSDGMPFGPLYGIQSAIEHPVTDERLTPSEAVWHYTREAAWSLHREDIGWLRQGNRADLLVLDVRTLDERPPADWVVQETISGGVSRGGNNGPLAAEQ